MSQSSIFLTPNLLQIVKDSELTRQIFDLQPLEFMLPQPSLHVLTALGCLSHVNVAFVRATSSQQPPGKQAGMLGNQSEEGGGDVSHAGVASSST